MLIFLALLGSVARAQNGPDLTALPDTQDKVVDLWGNELRLYFDMPDNFLVFLDFERDVQSKLTFGLYERNDMMGAYLRASNLANTIKEGEVDPGFVLPVREQKILFKAARRHNRTWVVLYASGPEGKEARFAIPQAWDLKDPKIKELIATKQGFEHMLIKAGL